MKLADDITISIGGEAITLRPSLRFALCLERRPGSFSRLAREIMDGSLSAACEIISDHTGMQFLDARVFDAGLDRLTVPLLSYIMACVGMDPDEAKTDAKNPKVGNLGKAVPFKEHLTNLYRIGTGWLGWTPQDTLDATPAEISEAYQGRLEMLKAIFGGSSEDTAEPADPLSLDEKFRTVFGSFGTTIVQRKAG